jgi:NADPH2:quinone reductase
MVFREATTGRTALDLEHVGALGTRGPDRITRTVFTTLARLMRRNGRLIPIGFVGGSSDVMNLPLPKNYLIVDVFTGTWMERFFDAAARAADTVMAWVGRGKLRPRIDRVLPSNGLLRRRALLRTAAYKERIVLQVT